MVGTEQELDVWPRLFRPGESAYQARKGVTTDANGIFFVEATAVADDRLVEIANDPRNGGVATWRLDAPSWSATTSSPS